MNLQLRVSFVVLVLLIGCSSHEELQPPDNPFDPGNPDYVSPNVDIISGPTEGEIIDATTVTFEWQGNELVTEYSYKLDNNAWSDWFDATSIDLEYLDEGQHSFSVNGRYESLTEDDTPPAVTFSVDAVQGPGLRVYPLFNEVSVGSTFDVYVYAEDVEGVVFAEIQVSYNPTVIAFSQYENGGLLGNTSDNTILIVEDNLGVLDISMATNFIDHSGISGTGALVMLSLTGTAQGSSELVISGVSTFLDFWNNDIPIVDIENGVVVSN